MSATSTVVDGMSHPVGDPEPEHWMVYPIKEATMAPPG